MKILARISRKTMQSNPVRTLVTIIGIMISTAMFTAIMTFTASLYNYVVRTQIYVHGEYHVGKNYVALSEYADWSNDEIFDKVGLGKIIGYSHCESINDYKPYIYVEAMDDEMLSLVPIHLSSGRLPQNENEIILPKHLYKNGGVSNKLGDEITLNIGDRYWVDEYGNPDKSGKLFQNNPFIAEDVEEDGKYNIKIFEDVFDTNERKFTVVGFYERPDFEDYSAPGYTAITYLAGNVEADADNVFFVRSTINKKHIKEAWWIFEEYSCSEINSDVLNFLGASRYRNIAVMFTMLVIVFVFIVMVGSVSMIYSAFSISVSERTKQFGLLSSIGATRKQVKKAVYFEAVTVSAIGIPVGIICGIVGIGVTLHFIGNRFDGLITSPFNVELVVNGWAVLVSVIISFFTVLISALIPSHRAMRVTAIGAIRQTADIKNESKISSRRKYTITKKIFGIPGLLARRYFSRSRKKYRVTIFSMSMSVILFIVTISYCEYLKMFVEDNVYDINYDFHYDYYGEDIDGVNKLLGDSEGLKEISYISIYSYGIYRPVLSDEITTQEYTKARQTFLDAYGEEYQFSVNSHVYFIDDASFLKYCKEIGISTEGYDLVNGGGILSDGASKTLYCTDENGEYIRKNVDFRVYNKDIQFLEFENDGEDNLVFPVYATTMQKHRIFNEFAPVLFFPFSSKYNEYQDSGVRFLVSAKEKQHEKMVEDILHKLGKAGFDTDEDNIFDSYESRRSNQNLLIIINVFSYGFIILMMLICVANVFNTISTNIALRRKDFAMLRSVGIDRRGIRKMMVYECLLYGARALLFGLPISVLLTYFIYEIYGCAGRFRFYIPWFGIAIAVIGVFVMVAISMIYAISKLDKNNVIEELKNENI